MFGKLEDLCDEDGKFIEQWNRCSVCIENRSADLDDFLVPSFNAYLEFCDLALLARTSAVLTMTDGEVTTFVYLITKSRAPGGFTTPVSNPDGTITPTLSESSSNSESETSPASESETMSPVSDDPTSPSDSRDSSSDANGSDDGDGGDDNSEILLPLGYK